VVEKLRRDSDFHAQTQTARSAVVEELFGEFKIPKAQRGQHFHTHGKAQSQRAAREEKKGGQRLRPLDDLEFFQVHEESVKLRREHSNHWINGEEDLDHWFSRPGRHQEKCTEEEINSCWISFRNPIIHWIWRR
jgi:hypothetical protein